MKPIFEISFVIFSWLVVVWVLISYFKTKSKPPSSYYAWINREAGELAMAELRATAGGLLPLSGEMNIENSDPSSLMRGLQSQLDEQTNRQLHAIDAKGDLYGSSYHGAVKSPHQLSLEAEILTLGNEMRRTYHALSTVKSHTRETTMNVQRNTGNVQRNLFTE
jgi:hypothetical protein